jgi:hypothetical protein
VLIAFLCCHLCRPTVQERDGDVVKTLCVRCQDKMGLLALVCSIISDHGHNIKVRGGCVEGVSWQGGRRGRRCKASGAQVAGFTTVSTTKQHQTGLTEGLSSRICAFGITTYDQLPCLTLLLLPLLLCVAALQSVSGLPEEDGEYNMTFVIKGSDAVLPQMLLQIMGVDGVHSYSVSCPEDPRSSDEE